MRYKGVAWVGAWDVLLRDPSQGVAMKERATQDGVEACSSLGALLACAADIVISAVTAANAFEVASEAAQSVRSGTFFPDIHSASPMTKAKAAKLLDGAGAHYI